MLSICPNCGRLGDRVDAEHVCRTCRIERAVLLSTDTLREMRARGVGVEDWLNAPPPPPTRAGCDGVPRPCPHLRCRHHNGMTEPTCDLDVAEDGGVTLREVAGILGVSRERVRQIEVDAMRKLRRVSAAAMLVGRTVSRR